VTERPARLAAWVPLLFAVAGCDLAYPEVVVVNKTTESMQLRHISFNGCLWDTVLAYGESTAVGECLPGEDRVHFERLNAEAYCQDQAEQDGDSQRTEGEQETAEPFWFAYQTTSVKEVDYGDFRVFEITLNDMEQDFSVPGPYGH